MGNESVWVKIGRAEVCGVYANLAPIGETAISCDREALSMAKDKLDADKAAVIAKRNEVDNAMVEAGIAPDKRQAVLDSFDKALSGAQKSFDTKMDALEKAGHDLERTQKTAIAALPKKDQIYFRTVLMAKDPSAAESKADVDALSAGNPALLKAWRDYRNTVKTLETTVRDGNIEATALQGSLDALQSVEGKKVHALVDQLSTLVKARNDDESDAKATGDTLRKDLKKLSDKLFGEATGKSATAASEQAEARRHAEAAKQAETEATAARARAEALKKEGASRAP